MKNDVNCDRILIGENYMLEIKDLTVSVGEKNILDNLCLNVKKGTITAIMGPNGVGKSTICRVLLGDESYKILSGVIKYNKKIINNLTTTDRARLGIYLVSQSPIAISGVTNAEMLRIALTERTGENIPLFTFNKKLENICAELGIPKEFIHKNINEGASGGERKKIELLHLWILEPELIILDELDSGLDVDSLKIVIKSLKKYYQQFKPTIIIITHHAKILDSLIPDTVHILKNGKINESGDKSLAKKIEIRGFVGANKVSENSFHE